MTSALVDIRDSLNKVLVRLSDTEAGASSREVVKVFRSEYGHLIARGSKELEDAALVQIASGLKRRRPPRSIEPVRDLFAALDQIVVLRVVVDGKLKRVNKTPRKLTLAEAEACLADHRSDRERNDRLIDVLEELIEKARPYIADEGTLEDGLAAAELQQNRAADG